MGSTKYPDENEYDSFLTQHGGSANAFTELEYTNFHFGARVGVFRHPADTYAHPLEAASIYVDQMK